MSHCEARRAGMQPARSRRPMNQNAVFGPHGTLCTAHMLQRYNTCSYLQFLQVVAMSRVGLGQLQASSWTETP